MIVLKSLSLMHLYLLAAALLLAAGGCSPDVAKEASDSDANGYLCTKCGAKFYTDRKTFLALECPKCQRPGLVQMVGYFCDKDQHMTMRARSDGRGPVVCEKCQAPLNGMRLPREKDLKTWGATKVSS